MQLYRGRKAGPRPAKCLLALEIAGRGWHTDMVGHNAGTSRGAHMTPQERELILKVADEVKAADRSAIDAEAERLIKTEVAAQRNAAYVLTQRVIVQELALKQAQAKIDELQARVGGAGSSGRGGFLPGAASGGIPGAAGQPWQGPHVGEPPPAAGGGGGGSAVGSFLKTAAAAAAGTVAANLIYDGLRGYAASHGGIGGMIPGFGGGHAGPIPGPSPEYLPPPGERYAPPPAADYGEGGDFGGPAVDGGLFGGGGDYGTDAETDSGSGGDFGTDDDQGGGADFGDAPDQDDDAGGGGDWGSDLGADFGTEDTGGGSEW